MQIRLLRSVKDGAGWHKPGAVMDVDEKEAKRLIKSQTAVSLEAPEEEEPEEELTEDQIVEELMTIDGVNETLAYSLMEAGYTSVQMIAEARQPELVKVKGIGGQTAVKIIEAASALLNEED